MSKLIRYEWKAAARVCIPMYGGLILVALLTHFMVFNLERGSQSFLYNMLTMAMGTLCFGLFVAAFVMTLIIQIQRFSKNLLGDEGYLMFTLPVSVSQLITSKLILAVILDVLSVVAAAVAVMGLAFNGSEWMQVPKLIGEFLSAISREGLNGWLMALEALIFCLSLAAMSTLHIYASIAIGHLARRHRTLAAFGAYFGFMVLGQLLIDLLFRIGLGGWLDGFGEWLMNQQGNVGSHLLIWLLILMTLAVGAVFFAITRYILKTRLNLE